jgi:hypothetical protein
MNRRLIRLILVVVLALFSTVLLVWALGAAEGETSRVRMVHSIPGPITVDVLVDGVLVYDDLAYKAVTPYSEVPAGLHTVTARTVFGDLVQTVYLTGGLDVTVVGVGSGLNVTATAMLDDNRAANAGTVRLVHLSPDTPAMDVMMTGTLGMVGVEALPYKEASDYLAGLGPGVVSFSLSAGGLNVPVYPPTATLKENAVHTLFLMGPQAFLESVPSVDAQFSDLKFKLYLPIVLLDAR